MILQMPFLVLTGNWKDEIFTGKEKAIPQPPPYGTYV